MALLPLLLKLLFGQRASACTFDHLFVRLPSLCLEVCLSFVICLKISLPFIQLLLFEQDTFVFYLKLPFKFRNVLQHIEAGVEAPLLVIKILKSWRFFKRNETKTADPPRKHLRNARVISAKELGTMSKNNLRRITLVRGPIWGIHSLTLIISCPLSIPPRLAV